MISLTRAAPTSTFYTQYYKNREFLQKVGREAKSLWGGFVLFATVSLQFSFYDLINLFLNNSLVINCWR